jgi:hypothetical protein
MSKKYILPPSLKYPFEQSEFPGDLNLREIREQGEKNKLPEVSFYQAIVIALLEQRNYFVVETLRYAKQYGQLPQEEDGNEPATNESNSPESEGIKAEAEVPETPQFKVLPPPTEQPRVKFTKSYGEEDQS